MNPECRYVEQNSGQSKYAFTVSLDSCGTQFINDFAGEAGQAYLENVLVLQVRDLQINQSIRTNRLNGLNTIFLLFSFCKRTSLGYRKFGTRCARSAASGRETSTRHCP